MKIKKLILEKWEMIPDFIKENEKFQEWIMPFALEEIRKTKQEIIKANWKKVELEKQLDEYKETSM